jgi:hypothetical protein
MERAVRTTLATTLVFAFVSSETILGAGKGVIETSRSPHVKVRAVDHDAVRWTEGFWADRFDLCRRTIVPNLHRVMMMPANSANFCNFQIAAGLRQGKLYTAWNRSIWPPAWTSTKSGCRGTRVGRCATTASCSGA